MSKFDSFLEYFAESLLITSIIIILTPTILVFVDRPAPEWKCTEYTQQEAKHVHLIGKVQIHETKLEDVCVKQEKILDKKQPFR